MKKQYLFLVLATCLMGSAIAQTTTIDSIQTGGSYGNDVYYSFATGQVKEAANSDWQLAFSIGSFNVAVRANTVAGSTKNGQVAMYEMPDTDTTQWSLFDTTNYKTTWALLDNSDEDWEDGALNQNGSGQFDYGWGAYNTSTHAITGHRLYLAVVTSGTTTLYKKVWVLNKISGTWAIRIANLDGSNSKDITIASTAYSTKNFVYLSLVTGEIVDREPAKTAWDFILTRYAAWQPAPSSVYYPSVGILTNAAVSVSEVRNKPKATTTLADTTAFSQNISTIGADWKQLNSSTFAFYAVDSLTYFVKATDGAIWKLTFSNFSSGSSPTGTGRAVFSKTKLTPSTGVATVGEEIKNVSVYPNPASEMLTVLFEAQSANSTVVITDLTGKQVYNKQVESSSFTNHTIDVSTFTKGIYFLSVMNGNSRSVQKVVVN